MKRRAAFLVALIAGGGGAAWCFAGCNGSSATAPSSDAGPSEDVTVTDAGTDAPVVTATDSGTADVGTDAPPVLTGMAIVSRYGAPLGAAPGDALPLKVVFTFSDGTTQDYDGGTPVLWTVPSTITAQNPDDAGPNGTIPAPGAQPTAFYIANPYRPERTDYPGVLFVVDPGTVPDAGVTVTAVLSDGGTLSAIVPIHGVPVGDPDAGEKLFQSVLICKGCHGNTGGGSPQETLEDGGLLFDDAGDPLYLLQGGTYPYPAPPLNDTYLPDNAGPNLAADPAWSAPLLGMAAQGDMDNNGVALRKPMPDWLGKMNAGGNPLSGQDFANIYAWLKTQTQ